MSRFNPAQWGQTRKIPSSQWQEDRPLCIVTKDGTNAHEVQAQGELPWTKNLTLGADIDPADEGVFALRWVIEFGVGGGIDSFEIDAVGLQQLSLSADLLRVSLVVRNKGIEPVSEDPADSVTPFAFAIPTLPIAATVFYTQGNTDTDPPTLTEAFDISGNGGAPTAVVIAVPKFASGFRLLGNPFTRSPFTANQTYRLLAASSASEIDVYGGDQIFGWRLAAIPTGEASLLEIDTHDQNEGILGSIEWEFDA